MKNLLIYINPKKEFDEESQKLVRIQIDNSLDLGWKKQDLILATNFPFLYQGLGSLLLPDNLDYKFDLNASKLPAIIFLIKNGFITEKELIWCHDLDAYELNKIEENELELENFDLGLTHYTYKPQWQFSSLFFRSSALDIFELLDRSIRENPSKTRNNEKHLTYLIENKMIDPKRFKKLNPAYNFTKRYIETVYREAEKPLKVLHFRPSDKDARMNSNALDMFMYGKNSLKMPLMNERLEKIFKINGIN